MTTQGVIERAGLEASFEGAALRRAHGPMMDRHFFREGAGFPTFHSGGENRDVVDATALDWLVSANVFEALAAKQLTSAGDIFDADETEIVGFVGAVLKRSAH